MDLVLQVVFLILLVALPLVSRRVEHNLELFFLGAGVVAASVGGVWSLHLLEEALLHPVAVYQPGVGYVPVGITQVVLLAGLAFYLLRRRLAAWAGALARPGVLATLVLALGLSSSVVSAVVAAAVLAELLAFARAPHSYKAVAAVSGAYAIGAGAALLPLGEPLSAIAVAKLRQGFFYLVDVLLDVVLILVIFFALYTYFALAKRRGAGAEAELYEPELREVFARAARVYVFIFALTILGEFFKPLAAAVSRLGREALYLFGAVSAVADNATLVAALVGPEMAPEALRSFLTSLLIAGGFTVPGNAPNIVLAGALKIGFREWLRLALPVGAPVFTAAGLYTLALLPHPPLL